LVLAFAVTALARGAGFPFPDGDYRGSALCRDPQGQEMRFKETLTVRGTAIKTVLHQPGGDEELTKIATFDRHGRFTWSGTQVVKGEGYCTSHGLCHWDITLRQDPKTVFDGEDTMILRDGKLQLAGSVTYAGVKYVCEEEYAK